MPVQNPKSHKTGLVPKSKTMMSVPPQPNLRNNKQSNVTHAIARRIAYRAGTVVQAGKMATEGLQPIKDKPNAKRKIPRA